MLRPLALTLLASTLLTLGACGDKEDTDTSEGDTDTDTDADTDSDTDSDTDTDTDTEPLALLGYSGSATAGYDGYDGTEDWYLIADEGDGEDICRISYTLKNTDERLDCPDQGHSGCIWAWDVTISEATIASESGEGCEGAFEITADTVADLNGSTFGIGYNPDYYGHAAVMLRDHGEGWSVATFAVWNEGSGSFTYQWDQGYIEP